MLLADYFVITVPLVDKIEAALPVLKAYWLPDPQPFSIYVYSGKRSRQVIFRQSSSSAASHVYKRQDEKGCRPTATSARPPRPPISTPLSLREKTLLISNGPAPFLLFFR